MNATRKVVLTRTGLTIDVSLTPCKARSPEDEVNFLMKRAGEKTIDRLWIIPDDLDQFCQWSNYTVESNCQYLQKFIDYANKTYGLPIGIGGGIDTWVQIFK